VNPIRGIPGDTVNVTGFGFNSSSLFSARGNITVAFYNASGTIYSKVLGAINTTSTGNFSILVTVPAVDYGSYNISATDQSLPTPNTATTIFTVSAIILINGANSASVPAGSIVTITGRGFSKQAGLLVNVSVGTTPAKEPTQILTVADGTFSGTFIVPTLTNNARYAVNAVDPNFTATTGSSSFPPTAGLRITGTTGITVTPTSGAPGTAITLTGQNFTYIAGTTVTVRFGLTPAGTLQIATFTTSATGGFSGSITVPTLPTGSPYYFNATDSNALNTTTTFAIAITALFLSPTSGPTGQVVALTAFGLGTTGGLTFNVTIGGAVLTPSSNLVSAIAAGTATVTVPTMPVGTYNVVATDNLGLSASAAFVVTATSTLTVNPSTAPVGVAGVTLTLTNFGAGAAVSYFIVNATSGYPLTVTPGTGFVTLTTNASGTLLAVFTVPGLALGPYTIIANETTGQWNATVAYTVGAATLNINPRATTYAQGSVLSFNIQSTFAASFTINIYDPVGTPGFMSISSALFTPIGNLWVYPYETGSMWGYTNGAEWVIPNDAVTGTWTWNATITSLGAVANGTFTVTPTAALTLNTTDVTTALSQINTTVNRISTNVLAINATVVAINGNIATLSTNTGYILANVTTIRANVTSIMGSIATIQTTLGTLQTSVNAINATIVAVNNGFATVQTSVGTLTTSVNSLGSTLTSVSGTVGTISTSVGSLTTSLSSIGTTVTGISGTVATIKTDLGTLTGTVTSIQGNVATIQTNLGTLQTSVGDLKTSVDNVPGQVNVPIWIAVVLALIAALAAIASLLLVRRKIAG
jgi:methyl-accepting chemotaxis protein